MRPTSSLGTPPSPSLASWLITLGFSTLASAILAPEPVSQPAFQLKDLGRVGLAGDFSAVSLYEYTGQAQAAPYNNESQSLMAQLPNGLFASIAVADGSINAMCHYESADGTSNGIMVGGNFTSLNGVEARGIALYNPEEDKVIPLDDFVGRVFALYCDKASSSVYVGGAFTRGSSENALVWDSDGWKDLPFEGFSSPVQTIARSSNDSIIFGGMFSSLRNFTAPSIKHVQVVNLASANVVGVDTSGQAGFDDPGAITCTDDTSKQWLLRDDTQGAWEAKFQFAVTPSKVRLINANEGGRGTKIFRFVSQAPTYGIMNLTYTDPATNEEKYCDAWCPLSQSDLPQDFVFVNNIAMKTIRIEIMEWYGAAGGLSSVQLFSNGCKDIFSYAIPTLNEPECAPAETRSGSIASGNWETVSPPGTDAYYQANLVEAERSAAQISFVPHVQQNGKYQILVYTPGCRFEGTCASRGEVQVSGIVTKDGAQIPERRFFQTNDFDKYDVIYEGDVDAADGSFKPTITLSPVPGQSLPVVNVVAQKVQLRLMSDNTATDGSSSGSATTTVAINGIYEFKPSESKASGFMDSKTTKSGLSLEKNAIVRSVVVHNDFTYVGGRFASSDDKFANFMALNKEGDRVDVPEGGLNGEVYAMSVIGDLLYIGGTFTQTKSGSTSGVSGFAAYDFKKNQWVSLGSGVNGGVADIVRVSLSLGSGTDGIAITGDFTQLQPGSSPIDAAGLAVWIPSQKTWLDALEGELTIAGVLTSSVLSGNDTIYSGSIASNSMLSSGAVYLSGKDKTRIQTSTLRFTSQESNSLQKRDVSDMGISGVKTGLFYVDKGYNLTVLGGRFAAQGKSGTIHNLAIIDGKTGDITGGSKEFNSQSTVLTMDNVGTQLFLGGSLEGDNSISGVAVWDLAEKSLAASQPPGLQGTNVTVYSVTNRPDTKDIYVAGDFETAGSLTCANLCIYDTKAKQWRQTGSNNPGVIYTAQWIGANSLLVGGDMKLNNTVTYLALFNAQTSTFQAVDGDVSKLPGPVKSVAKDSDDATSFFVSGTNADGSSYLVKFQDRKVATMPTKFGKRSDIQGIQVLELMKKTDATDFLDGHHALVVTGSLDIQGFGNASVVTWDGSAWLPFLLTSRADGEPGAVSSFFSEYDPVFSPEGKKMARGFVILISLAIALALVFLLVVCGVLASYLRRRSEGYTPAPTMAATEKSVAMQDRLPPQDLFQQGVGRGSYSDRPPAI
ncbi:hypothetical protein EX30DRAFT_354763 [Ascodesmis nigricans]|uniref:Cellular morphogenesis protein n=1 Tax=Ascodesmis nigricans TaxID=341454 RepID=A0A4S2MYT9_9PEZI|nr:hypothetical protein EX30DRAFT_354763 [Ascodesmis nigricans]